MTAGAWWASADDDSAPSVSTRWRCRNRLAVSALCSSWITSTCRRPPHQNRTVSASAGSNGSSGGGIDWSSYASRVTTAHTRVRLSISRTPSACAPSPKSCQRIARLKEAFHDAGIRMTPPLGPDQLDEGRQEGTPVATNRPTGSVQGEGSRTVVLGQSSTGRVGGLVYEQVDNPGNEEVLLVDQVDVRSAAQRRQ